MVSENLFSCGTWEKRLLTLILCRGQGELFGRILLRFLHLKELVWFFFNCGPRQQDQTLTQRCLVNKKTCPVPMACRKLQVDFGARDLSMNEWLISVQFVFQSVTFPIHEQCLTAPRGHA